MQRSLKTDPLLINLPSEQLTVETLISHKNHFYSLSLPAAERLKSESHFVSYILYTGSATGGPLKLNFSAQCSPQMDSGPGVFSGAPVKFKMQSMKQLGADMPQRIWQSGSGSRHPISFQTLKYIFLSYSCRQDASDRVLRLLFINLTIKKSETLLWFFFHSQLVAHLPGNPAPPARLMNLNMNELRL